MDFRKILKKTWVKIAAILGGLVLIFEAIDYIIKFRISSYISNVVKDLCKWIISRPNYGLYSLSLLTIFIIVIITLFIKWYRLYLTHERFEDKFGVFWDKKKRMHCIDCHKLLKNATKDPSTFFCSDPKCDNKHFLRDRIGNPITEREAIEKMENNT